MDLYIKLAQSKIEPNVLQEIIDICWDKLGDREQQRIIDVLKESEVQFE